MARTDVELSGNELLWVQAEAAKGKFIRNETPSGTVNSVNVTFTLANAPITGSLDLYLDGQLQTRTTDYTLSGLTVTMVLAPQTNSILLADYRY